MSEPDQTRATGPNSEARGGPPPPTRLPATDPGLDSLQARFNPEASDDLSIATRAPADSYATANPGASGLKRAWSELETWVGGGESSRRSASSWCRSRGSVPVRDMEERLEVGGRRAHGAQIDGVGNDRGLRLKGERFSEHPIWLNQSECSPSDIALVQFPAKCQLHSLPRSNAIATPASRSSCLQERRDVAPYVNIAGRSSTATM